MVVMRVVPGVRHIKMAFRAATGLILHLHGHMLNIIFMLQKCLDAIQQSVVIVRRDNLNMQRHNRFFADQPDVDVVYVADFRHRAVQIALQPLDI